MNIIKRQSIIKLILVFSLLFIRCNDSDKEPNCQQELTSLMQLVQDYSANYKWTNRLDDINNKRFNLFSVDVEDALVTEAAEPLLIWADLIDIRRQDTYYIARFILWTDKFWDEELYFELQCNNIHKDWLRRLPSSDLADRYSEGYVLIADILDVRKIQYRARAYGYEDEPDYYEPEIVIDAPETFIVSGRLIDMIYAADMFCLKSNFDSTILGK